MTLEEGIQNFKQMTDEFNEQFEHEDNVIVQQALERSASETLQYYEWLRELKRYREILANADKIIESRYGCVIIEGYADVIDQMNEIFLEVSTDEKL